MYFWVAVLHSFFVFYHQLAGIDKPNDGECHMVPHEKAGEYIYSEELTQVGGTISVTLIVAHNLDLTSFAIL